MFCWRSGGQGAFRREPALTDRQQNIRLAMDLISRDIAGAGAGLGLFFQSFTDSLNGVGPVSPSGTADELQIQGNDGSCPDVPAQAECPGNRPGCATSGANLNTALDIPSCYSEDALVAVIYQGEKAKWGFGHKIHGQDTKLNFPPGLNGNASLGSEITSVDTLGAFCSTCSPADNSTPTRIALLNRVKYAIAPDPADNVPGLWRSSTGGVDPTTGAVSAAGAGGNWQLIARGIEDMQIRYRKGDGSWNDTPGTVTCACAVPNAAQLQIPIREVRVTLSARALGANLAGQTRATNTSMTTARDAVRGQLTQSTSVKATLNYLSQATLHPWQ